MSKFRAKYEYRPNHGHPEHVWTVIGRLGAMHFHVTDMGEQWIIEHPSYERYSGGLEIHYRSPPDYMRDDAPSQDKCWLIGCPCWHDGTSLYASETLIPYWLVEPHDHQRMFHRLEMEYADRFKPEDEAAE
jgi:hypothetical protein